MTLSNIDKGLDALDNSLNGIEKQLSALYQKLGVNMDSMPPEGDGQDISSRVDGIHSALMGKVIYSDWLGSKVHEAIQILDPDEPEVTEKEPTKY